jgi:hypothetical protein
MSGEKQKIEKETIAIAEVLSKCVDAARKARFKIETLPVEPLEIIALSKVIKNAKHRIYISAGIHGDEPAGPLAILKLLESNIWPKRTSLWIFPCLNPSGFLAATRENSASRDLNRDYLHLDTPEIRAHTKWLSAQPQFDLTLCLHEDWEAKGFYLYEAKQDHHQTLSEEIIKKVAQTFPIDMSKEIDGYPAENGIINVFCDCNAFTYWPEALYLCHKKNSLNYTLETPSSFPLPKRVKAMVNAIKEAMKACCS